MNVRPVKTRSTTSGTMASRPRLIFRADGNPQVGLGHVMRCLALADMLGNGYDRHLAIIQPSAEVITLVEKVGVNVLALFSPEEDEFLAHVKSTDTLILDGHNFGRDYQLACRSAAWALVYIDDLCLPNPVANVVVNHAGGISRADYYGDSPAVHRESTLLLGPDYALLRPAFLDSDGFGTVPADGPILVSLGGADHRNASLTALEAIRQGNIAHQVRLIVGPLHSTESAIDTLAAEMPNVQLLANLSATQMAGQIRACRLAIVACSTVAYEVCSVGRPFIGIQTADNQSRLRAFFDQKKLAVATLDGTAPVELLVTAIRDALSRPHNAWLPVQQYAFDGRSSGRFRDLFTRLCSSIA